MPNPEWENYEPDREKALRLARALRWYINSALPTCPAYNSPVPTFPRVASFMVTELTERFKLTDKELL